MAVGVLAGVGGAAGNVTTFSKPLGLRVELGESALVDLDHLADLGINGKHALVPAAILEDGQAGEPCRAFAGHRSRWTSKPWSSTK